MLNWLRSAVSSVARWLGDGVASFFDWLFSGIITIFTAIVDAANGFWAVLDALWDFAVGFKDSILGLFTVWFPFIPESVMTVISLGLLSVLLVGIVRKVRR